MNLLPKSSHEFGQSEYWNTFFKKRGTKAFEWYGEYPELCDQLHKYTKIKDSILMAGCGNSKLSMDMYDVGFRDITNIDISQVVIRQMQDINKKKRPDMKFIQMDATAMTFPEESFSVVLDKGTLDALMTEDNEEVIEVAQKYCTEICRVLKNGGRYVCISLLQEHILKFLLQFFPRNSCMFRVVRCFEAEQKTSEASAEGQVMPVFVVIATKFRNLPQTILEICLGGDKMQRLQTTDELLEAVTSIQKAALVCNGLSRSNIAGLHEVSIDLIQPTTQLPRYTVHVLDQPPARDNGKYAAFIVPQGREVEWLFSTPQGRQKLLSSARHNRLAVVTMHRDQKYSSWDSVKNELSESVRTFAPHGLKEQIPFLSLGSDVGTRKILHKGTSNFSGDYIVEEVKGQDKKIFRRLIFLSNQSVIQSEALVKIMETPNKRVKTIDFFSLACQHHLFMTIGANYSVQHYKKNEGNVLVIGLGGGGLCMFMRRMLRNTKITAVEIDIAMFEVAAKYFGLEEDNRFNVVIDDGLKYLNIAAKSKQKFFDAVLFDVDSKDTSVGMSCPPKNFLENTVLENVKQLIGNTGLFIVNLVCRDEKLREEVMANLKNAFRSVSCYKLDEDVNEVVYCCNYDNMLWCKSLESSSEGLNLLAKKLKITKDDMIDVSDFISDLKI